MQFLKNTTEGGLVSRNTPKNIFGMFRRRKWGGGDGFPSTRKGSVLLLEELLFPINTYYLNDCTRICFNLQVRV